MFKHILLPTDGSKLSDKGVRETIKMAKALRAKITAVNVVGNYHQRLHDEGFVLPVIPALRKDFEDRAAAHAKEILDPVREAAGKAGVKCDTVVATGDLPYEMIINQAKRSKCDLIMMASHGRSGIKSILLGSETVRYWRTPRYPCWYCVRSGTVAVGLWRFLVGLIDTQWSKPRNTKASCHSQCSRSRRGHAGFQSPRAHVDRSQFAVRASTLEF